MFGMRLKLVIPRGQVSHLRRCVNIVSQLTSDESSFQHSISTIQPEDSSSSSLLKQSIENREIELNHLSVPSLKELCRKDGIRLGGMYE